MPNERNPSEPCDIVPSCPICGALMELSRRVGQIHVCVCTDCGTVTCLPDVEVKIAPAKGVKNSRLGDVTEIFLKGKCPECTE